jgi:hypothetical protein
MIKSLERTISSADNEGTSERIDPNRGPNPFLS